MKQYIAGKMLHCSGIYLGNFIAKDINSHVVVWWKNTSFCIFKAFYLHDKQPFWRGFYRTTKCKKKKQLWFLGLLTEGFYTTYFKVRLKLICQVFGNGPELLVSKSCQKDKYRIFWMMQKAGRTIAAFLWLEVKQSCWKQVSYKKW